MTRLNNAGIADRREDEAHKSSEIGQRIKAFRTTRRLTLRQLADMTGTTASFISQLERGLSGVNTNTLMRIANALAIGIADLFEDRKVSLHQVIRRADRPALPPSVGYRKTILSSRPIREFEVYGGEFGPGESTGKDAYVHGGTNEMFVVLRGEVELTLGSEQFVLREGDSIEYSTTTPHKTRNVGPERAEVLWIISPPTSGVVELDQYIPRKLLAAGEGKDSESHN
ncbi:helix-turn-helix transcriptional regulator [Rhizobium sp. KVB221]|uniref:Helix-turn-helix transcriptional regulator n=1 Tax=Rhizobium setariae TaxID=2801340 RepID=A0A937CNI6_9HYPH|nr:XRE family transcriptional regulator [Rhizobium setariae]MBL0371228.1 helix-turn-helix transcriptional regulator [Rhizobium setariae]